jgi:hypothetical protein
MHNKKVRTTFARQNIQSSDLIEAASDLNISDEEI